MCCRKPLVATCGLDKSVRVWNYLDKSTEIVQYFAEDCHSVAFHPSGLHLLVGFGDKLLEATAQGIRSCIGAISNSSAIFACACGVSFSTPACAAVSATTMSDCSPIHDENPTIGLKCTYGNGDRSTNGTERSTH